MYWVAGIFAAVLVAFSNRYGYHRDELYFLAAGRHPAWGYADQPPFTPLVARAMSAIDPESLPLLRTPAVLAATLVVVCAGLMAREFGGGRAAQALAAAAVAGAALVQGAGHLLSTAVFDLAAWSLLGLLVLRLLRDAAGDGPFVESADEVMAPESSVGAATDRRPDPRWWLAIGLVAGLGLLNKSLLIFPATALVIALLVVGPRKVLATRYLPASVGLATLLWLPYLWWQAHNGWPQWDVGRAIAGGSSGTSDSPIMFVLLQFGLMGPLLTPLWIYGLWRLWRESRYRAFPVAYGLLFVVFLLTGGKAYYLGGMYPILLAAGAVPLAARLGRRPGRWAAVGAVVTVNAIGSAVLFLPVLPVSALPESPVLAVNYDAGETIGWPEFVRRIGAVRADLGPDVAVFTANYGEAGAIERFGAPYDLPTPHSGHNAYWWWGPPPDTATEVLTVGIERDQLAELCASVEPAGHLDNGLGIDNDEQGEPLFVCRELRAPWRELWPRAQHLG
ncbi:glycosyltransferase family 39 protein [Nocardia lijiangensis]|uniref:glycosyltransferase family 39 protein n=1 Tax=Nocardia lijiangensis TaxID=299618 RepID=UPI003D72115A